MKKRTKKTKDTKNETNSRKSVPPFDIDLEPPVRQSFDNDFAFQPKTASEQKYTKNEIRKKQNKKRKLKNGVRNALITVCVALGICAIGIVLSLTMFFNISTINISGSGTYSEEQIDEVCSIEIGDNLFLIDKDKCREELTKKLPYIYDIKIKRKLPVTLEIQIVDAVAAYSIANEDGTYILLDDNFKVLENAAESYSDGVVSIADVMAVDSAPGNTIEFENGDTLNCLKSISEAIKAVGMENVSLIRSVDKNNNSVLYNGRITFELGNCDNLENKLYKGLAAYEGLQNRMGTVKGRLNISDGKQVYFTEE